MKSNSDAVEVLGNIAAQNGTSRKPLHETLNEEEMNTARALCEMANGIRPSLGYDKKTEKTLGKRKLLEVCSDRKIKKKKSLEDGSRSTRSHWRVEHRNEVCNANDHNGCSVQDLYSAVVAEAFPRQNPVPETSSKHQSKQIRSISKAIQILVRRGFDADQFSFSVIHLLSAVRDALSTPLQFEFGQDFHCTDQTMIRRNLPILMIHDIVQCVRSKPGDPRLLQCTMPLIELVRGVMKIFSSEMPLGARSWHPLTAYDHLRKRWRWIGPVPSILNSADVDVSCTAWGLSSENLTKLVGQFSVWLRRVQPALELVASLPEPPLELMQGMNFETRFNRRKKLNVRTISPSCNEVKAYFHREEAVRYLIPDRSFVYTALDGQKSAVAPLRKESDKMLSKSRGHHIFKTNRPPQFSLLSLVRDAAARLPGGVGTKTDICSLVRESQYIVDDILDKSLKKIISGALDRLHGEVDPCVQYIAHLGVWTYLHKNREVEDFA